MFVLTLPSSQTVTLRMARVFRIVLAPLDEAAITLKSQSSSVELRK